MLTGQLRAGTNRLLARVDQLGLAPGFALRVLPPRRAVLTGKVLDAHGKLIRRAVTIAVFQGEREIERIGIDDSGTYHLSLLLERDEPCDIAFTAGEQGCWWLAERLGPGERRVRDATLQPSVSVAGSLTMLDAEQSPHREITVEAVRDGTVVATTLSDEKGHYRFVNLRPGTYRVRCQTPRGYCDCRPAATTNSPAGGAAPARLAVEAGQSQQNVDARFAAFKKGVWQHYDTLDGVPNNRVSAIAPSRGGGLWLQTAGGLGHYDGLRFVTVPGTESLALTAMAVAADGTVWLGTYAGIRRYSGGAVTNFAFTNGLPDEAITSLLVSRSGELWIGTAYGLAVCDGQRQRRFTAADGLTQNDITTLGQTPDGVIWIGTHGGLASYDGQHFRLYTAADGLGGNEVTALECSTTNGVRVATVGSLAQWNGHGFTPLLAAGQSVPRWIRCLYAAPDGRLWLGTQRGVSVLHGQQMINFHANEGLGGGDVSSIVATPEGLLWFGTEGGVARFDPGVANYSTKDGLADNRLFDLGADPDAVWLGMQWGGVGRYDGHGFTTVLPGLYARKLHRTSEGVLWVGCDKGALRLDGTRVLPGSLLTNRWVMAIASDTNGTMWFGAAWSGGGLVRVQTNAAGATVSKTFTPADGLAHNEVNCILCLRDGETWVGTPAGVSKITGDKIQNFAAENGLPSNLIRSLYQAKDGSVWLGTGRGVARYAAGQFRNLSAEHGLPAGRITAIYQSRDGLMWFGTETQGVCVFDGRAFATLDTRDGLAGNAVLAITEDAAGQLWLATAKDGVTCYRRKTVAPQVRLRQIRAGGKLLPETAAPPRLRAEEPVTFSYEAADWLSAPEKRQFRVRLSRLGSQQTPTAPILDVITRKADFDWTPPEPGDYALELQAINLNLVYSAPARRVFSVFRPWHENVAWRALLGLLITTTLLGGYWLAWSNWEHRRQARRLKDLMLEQERATHAAVSRVLEQRTEEWRQATSAALAASEEEARRIGRELHDTLCQDLIGVSRQAEAAALAGVAQEAVSPIMAGRLQNLASLAAAAARQARGLSHLLAVSEPVAAPLEESLQGHVRQLEKLYGFTCELSLGEALPAWSPEQGAHIIRIIREALINAALHAQARRIWVDCLQEDRQFILSISSDGLAPQAPDQWQAGLGLRQMQMRAALLGATLTFRPGVRGAVVQLIIPRSSHS